MLDRIWEYLLAQTTFLKKKLSPRENEQLTLKHTEPRVEEFQASLALPLHAITKALIFNEGLLCIWEMPIKRLLRELWHMHPINYHAADFF